MTTSLASARRGGASAVSRSVLGYQSSLLMLAAAAVYTIYSVYLAVNFGGWQLIAHAAVMVAYCAVSALSAWLSRRGRPDTGMRILTAALIVTALAITLLIADIGLAMAAICITVAGALALLVLEPGNLGRYFVLSLAAGYSIGAGNGAAPAPSYVIAPGRPQVAGYAAELARRHGLSRAQIAATLHERGLTADDD